MLVLIWQRASLRCNGCLGSWCLTGCLLGVDSRFLPGWMGAPTLQRTGSEHQEMWRHGWVVRHRMASVERREANPKGAGFNPGRVFDAVFTSSLRACVGFLHSHIVSCDGGGDLQCCDHLYKTFTTPERISLIETGPKGLNDVTTGQIRLLLNHMLLFNLSSCV